MGIKIVDPNKVINDYVSGPTSNQEYPSNIGGRSTTTPPEDLVTYVDLEVFMPGRSVIVDDVARNPQRRENIGFIVPKKLPEENLGKMGTSWTNIGGLQGFQKNDEGKFIVDGNGNFQKEGEFNETFGIQDIQIKLNASFEPQVFITFVDIRGASLMEPGLNSPYAAFFHMPYPLFTLTVKGFYGRGIAYKLHLMKFNARFDNETGNFVIKCEFIGFTFTYLADIPAIYADIGPELLGFYGTEEGGQEEFATDFEAGRDPRLPWPEGSMTLGTYIQNISNLAAKMDHFEDDAISTDYLLLRSALDSLRLIEGRWNNIPRLTNCSDAASAGCSYTFSTSMIITVKELYTDTGALVSVSEAETKRFTNTADAYRQLQLQLAGKDTNTGDATTANVVNILESNFKGFVQQIYDGLTTSAKDYLGQPPRVSLINQDNEYEVYGLVQPFADPTSEDGEMLEDRYGIAQIDAQNYFKELRAYITKGESKLKELEKKKNEQENELKLNTLVMPPTLENVFKLLCNGVTAFQKVLVEVGKLAYEQHNSDQNIRALLLNEGGSDIKSLQDNSSELYAFPLYYETRTDSVPAGTTGTAQRVNRIEKQFPGWKVNKTTYGRPDFISPLKWPEITLVEKLIHLIIKKQRELQQGWEPNDDEFGEDGYIPATLEETPLLPVSPYLRLTEVKEQIIPLLLIRTMMRLGHTNNFPSTAPNDVLYPGFGNETSATIEKIRNALKNDTADVKPDDDNGGYDAIKSLAELEARTLQKGVLDYGKKRIRQILLELTGNAAAEQQRSMGRAAADRAIELLKEAGYQIEKKTLGNDTFVGYRGANDPLDQVFTYHSVVGTTGQEVTNLNEFWLPNIDTKLSTNIFYDTCSDADYAMECKGFYISSVAYYTTNSTSEQQVEGLSTDQVLSAQTSADKLTDWYKTCFGEDDDQKKREWSKVDKLFLGPQGTLDYDYKLWLGWDFFSYWSRSKYTKKVQDDLQSLNFSNQDHISPDQFAPHAVMYSAPYRPTEFQAEDPDRTSVGWDADKQTFLLEDMLWIKNDWQNTTINNYTVVDDAGNYQYIPYSRAADSSGYEAALDGQGSGVVNPEMASNLALGYLWINNLGKYFTTNSHSKSTDFTKKNDLTRFFDQVAGYSVMPEYVVLQIGSWLYRYEEANDIIRWPNYFSSMGQKQAGRTTYMIPTKSERPQPRGDMFSRTDDDGNETIWSANYRRAYRNSANSIMATMLPAGVDARWMGASDFNNRLHFIGGRASDWVTTNGNTIFEGGPNDAPAYSPEGAFGYERIGNAFLFLPAHIKKQFIDKFVMWATGRPLGTQTYNLNPSFPEIKRAATATVTFEAPDKLGYCFDQAEYSLNDCQGCDTPGDGSLTPRNNPKRRAYTSFCDLGPVGYYNQPSAYPGSGNVGHSVKNWGEDTDHSPPAQVGVVDDFGLKFFQFNNGICTHTTEAAIQYYANAAYHRSHMTVNYATRESNMTATTDNYITNLYNDLKGMKKQGTYTLPLFYNGFINNVRNADRENFNGKKSPDGHNTATQGSYQAQLNNTAENGPWEEHPQIYTQTAIGAFNYYFIRKASHTDRIVYRPTGTNISGQYASSWDWKGSTSNTGAAGTPPPSQRYQIQQNGQFWWNDAYNGFPEVGMEVYANFHYRNPIRSQAYKAKQEEYDNKGYAGINYERSHPFLVENSMIGGVVPKIYGKPCFYIPENHYSVNYHEDHPSTLTIDTRVLAGSEEATRNELYDMIETFMKNRVSVKNQTWRHWIGVGPFTGANGPENEKTVSTIFTHKEYLDLYFDVLLNSLVDYVEDGDQIEEIKAIAKEEDLLEDNDIKLDTYLTLKNIHDKWLTGSSADGLRKMKLSETYDFDQSGVSWLYSQFSFVDRAYTDIKHKIIDPTALLNLKENPKISLYTLMYDLIADNQFEFFPLPTTVDFSSKNFESSFVPHLTVDKDSIDQNPRFYVMYMGGFSDSLDMEDKSYQFSNDGFDITEEPCLDCPADYNKGDLTTIINQQSIPNGVLLVEGQAKDDGGFILGDGGPINIPTYGNWVCIGNRGVGDCKIQEQDLKAFAVNYAQENQNFFKSISLDQAEFQETQESLLIIDALAQEEGTSKDPMLKGQNLLNVYQKRSYSCSVTAFGMMSLLPLQYFQLNNVPMFHGAYIITNVEHSVTPGDVETTFKGVRISRSTIPYVSSFLTAIQDNEGGTSNQPKYDEKLDTRNLNVLSGDVERIGLWFERDVNETRVKLMKKYGVNSVAIELCTGWSDTAGGSTRWQSYDWDWQPYRQVVNGRTHKWTKRARYSLDGLKDAIKILSENDIYVTIMLYFNPNYNYIEAMCGGSGVQTYVKKDYDSEGLDTPFTLPELINELNNHCPKCKVDAVEFDLEGHYRKSRYDGGWKSGSKPLGYNDNVNKKDLAKAVMKKLRDTLPTGTEIGTTVYVGRSPSLNENYWADPSTPEYSALADYVAVQAYTHTKCNPKSCRTCTSDSDCPSGAVCMDNENGRGKKCYNKDYNWDGYAGPGKRQKYSGNTIKKISESNFNGANPTDGKPYLIMGLSGYYQKFAGHTISEALVEAWNAGIQPITGNSYKPKEVRYWSYANVFGKNGGYDWDANPPSGPVADFIKQQAEKNED